MKHANKNKQGDDGDEGKQLSIMEALEQAFARFDSDGGGYIDEHELRNLLSHLGFPQTPAQVHELMYYLDASGDGYVGFDEFKAWWTESA